MNKIKIFREEMGLTVKALAAKADIATGYLSDLENNNKNNPSKEKMIKIAKALEKSVTEVFFPKE